MLDAALQKAYLAARMKRLLALLALVLGMTSLVAPAHARMVVSAECSEAAGLQNAPAARPDHRGDAVSAECRKKRNRPLGKPFTGTFRTVVLPTVMLVDRPLE